MPVHTTFFNDCLIANLLITSANEYIRSLYISVFLDTFASNLFKQQMANQEPTSNLPQDEFDIEILAQKLYRINKRFFYKLMFPVRVIASNVKRTGLIILVAVVCAIIGRYAIPPIYKTSFVIKPNNQTENVYLNMLNDLDILLDDKNYEEIAKDLKISELLASQLKDIKVNPVFKNEFKKDTINMVEIVLLLRNAQLIDTFQNSIINVYLNQSAYYTKLQQIKDRDLQAMEERLVYDLKENDSLKRTVTANAFPRNSGGFVYGEPIDPLKIYQSGLQLYQHLLYVRLQKEFTHGFELVKPGVIRIKPYFPRLIILLPAFIFVGFIVSFVLNNRALKAKH